MSWNVPLRMLFTGTKERLIFSCEISKICCSAQSRTSSTSSVSA